MPTAIDCWSHFGLDVTGYRQPPKWLLIGVRWSSPVFHAERFRARKSKRQRRILQCENLPRQCVLLFIRLTARGARGARPPLQGAKLPVGSRPPAASCARVRSPQRGDSCGAVAPVCAPARVCTHTVTCRSCRTIRQLPFAWDTSGGSGATGEGTRGREGQGAAHPVSTLAVIFGPSTYPSFSCKARPHACVRH